MPSKLIVKDTRTNHTFDYQLTRDETRIGRAGDRSDLVLDDGQVSRVHAIVKRTGSGYTLVDLDSANGTWIDEQRVSALHIWRVRSTIGRRIVVPGRFEICRFQMK